MTDAPETIWAWNFIASKQNEFMTGGWDDKIELETSGKETEYTRTDISQARIAELEAQAIGFRESIRKAALDMADAILAALPDMIAPLVWEGNIAQNNMGGRYVIGWYDAGDLCTALDFHGYGNPDTRQYIGGDTFVSDLKAAANTHHRDAIIAIFTGETTT
jgi:hypothetical protein